ncbi:ketimine reductase mu-crystallin [Elysia marginata]|uniref:Ketimine reductase mu-crystallin n=1 Tax=Elysia marginata TaxID=1093978 RepID=A0AAV4FM07_9GAST|nr:ketimine reductase mu-crystallin [Elysia marginata]
MEEIKFISADQVGRVLTYALLNKAVERGLALFSQNKNCGQEDGRISKLDQPVRTVVSVPSKKASLVSMPVYIEADQLLVTKLVTFFPKNESVPKHNAIIAVFNANTGVPRAFLDGETITIRRTAAASVVATQFLDGETITIRRTAAASVVATQHLANGQPTVLAILGSGVQAASHYEAFCETFGTLQQVRVWNHKPEGAKEFASKDERRHNCVACESVEDAVRDADVIVTVTSSSSPIVMTQWVKPGAHINAVGACRLEWAEIDPNLMRSAIVYVDSREGALQESGDLFLSKAEVYAEIGDVVNGTKTAHRDKTTVFKSLGMAVEDAVAAKIVLDGLGL